MYADHAEWTGSAGCGRQRPPPGAAVPAVRSTATRWATALAGCWSTRAVRTPPALPGRLRLEWIDHGITRYDTDGGPTSATAATWREHPRRHFSPTGCSSRPDALAWAARAGPSNEPSGSGRPGGIRGQPLRLRRPDHPPSLGAGAGGRRGGQGSLMCRQWPRWHVDCAAELVDTPRDLADVWAALAEDADWAPAGRCRAWGQLPSRRRRAAPRRGSSRRSVPGPDRSWVRRSTAQRLLTAIGGHPCAARRWSWWRAPTGQRPRRRAARGTGLAGAGLHGCSTRYRR